MEGKMESKVLPAYLIGRINVKDHADYMNRYAMPVLEQFKAAGAEILVATPQPEVLEGEWKSNWTVLVRFPSMEAARKFYHSDEYAPFRALRINELTNEGTALLVEGFDLAALGL